MASVPTVPAFVHSGGWDETTRKHPATKAMELLTNEYDNSNVLNPAWYTSNASFQTPDGLEYDGLDAMMEATKQAYEPLTSHYHEPQSIICIEAGDGYKMYGQAKLFGNLPGTNTPYLQYETKFRSSMICDRSGPDFT